MQESLYVNMQRNYVHMWYIYMYVNMQHNYVEMQW